MTEAQGKALLPSLRDKNASVRLQASLQLAVAGWTFAIPDLMHLADQDPDDAVRKAAIYALGEIRDYAPYSLLQSIWQSTTEPADIVQEALDACDKIDGLINPDNSDTGDSTGTGDLPPEF